MVGSFQAHLMSLAMVDHCAVSRNFFEAAQVSNSMYKNEIEKRPPKVDSIRVKQNKRLNMYYQPEAIF